METCRGMLMVKCHVGNVSYTIEMGRECFRRFEGCRGNAAKKLNVHSFLFPNNDLYFGKHMF